MTFPVPVPGLVLRYAFLWSHEARSGIEEGAKDRPCAVLLTMLTRAGRDVAMVVPITHTPPDNPDLAVELPQATKKRLGLDGDRSWIVLNEANRFYWPGPDLRTIQGGEPGQVAYGALPHALYEIVRTKWLEIYDKGQARQINRSE